MTPLVSLKSLPFHVGTFSMWPKGLPKSLPFSLTVDEETGLIREVLTPPIEAALKLYYEAGGYSSTPLGEGEYAKGQGKELFDWVADTLRAARREVAGSSFLEIGASYGYLLHLLKRAGASRVVGIEPGEAGPIGAKKYGIEMIPDFFPTSKLKGRFDCVFNYGVLGHILSPSPFLKAMRGVLADGGVALVAVPASGRKLRVGDPSIILHEHINYFTEESLAGLFRSAGFDRCHVVNSPRRAMLLAWAEAGGSGRMKNVAPETRLQKNLLKTFNSNLKTNIAKMQALVNRAEGEGKSIGFYAPCSSLLGQLRIRGDFRIFDGDTWKHGRHITGVTRPFESPVALRRKPVDLLFICPIDYDSEIRQYLAKNGLLGGARTEVVSLKKMYEETSGTRYTTGL